MVPPLLGIRSRSGWLSPLLQFFPSKMHFQLGLRARASAVPGLLPLEDALVHHVYDDASSHQSTLRATPGRNSDRRSDLAVGRNRRERRGTPQIRQPRILRLVLATALLSGYCQPARHPHRVIVDVFEFTCKTEENKRADERTRTADLLITSELLYQLSYVGLLRAQSISQGSQAFTRN